jgi:hypothetical protein
VSAFSWILLGYYVFVAMAVYSPFLDITAGGFVNEAL